MGCPGRVELNRKKDECVEKNSAYFKVYATDFLAMHPELLKDVRLKRWSNKEGIIEHNDIGNEDEVDCGPGVDPTEDCDL